MMGGETVKNAEMRRWREWRGERMMKKGCSGARGEVGRWKWVS